MLNMIKAYNRRVRELVFTVIEALSGIIIALSVLVAFFGAWGVTGGIVTGFFAGLFAAGSMFAGMAFAFGVLFMLLDIRKNTQRTAVAMEKLAGAGTEEKEPAKKPAPKKAKPEEK